jgi:hypothetical protein
MVPLRTLFPNLAYQDRGVKFGATSNLSYSRGKIQSNG